MFPGGLADYFLNTTSEAAETGPRCPSSVPGRPAATHPLKLILRTSRTA